MRLKLIGVPVAAGVVIGLVVLSTGALSGPNSSSVGGVPDGGAVNEATAEFKVDGMYCSLCAANLGRVLEEQPGVVAARVDFDKNLAIVSYDASKMSAERLKATLEDSGVFHADLASLALPQDKE